MFAIFTGAQCRCHIVWLHSVFVCCKMYAQRLARGAAARFYLSTLRGFVFSLFSFRLVCFSFSFFRSLSVCFLLLCFLPCFLSCLFRSFSFLVRCFPCLVFLSLLCLLLLLSNNNNNNKNTYFVGVCVCVHTHAHTHTRVHEERR